MCLSSTTFRYLTIVVLVSPLVVTPVHAAISESQVLVVYNSASADATALLATYLAAHPGLPAANICNLNDASLLVADLTYSDYVNKVRTPIRNFLLAAGPPAPADIVAIALLRPIPHRIQDTDNATVGDSPGAAGGELQAGDSTYAAVDAELALLWQNLNAGEAGATMDSLADNVIDNPYHTSSMSIAAFSRANITAAKVFDNAGNAAWLPAGAGATRLTAGDIYLVCRIDGNSLSDAQALIDRAADNVVDPRQVRILLDEYDLAARADLDDDPLFMSNDPFLAGDDYEETRDLLQLAGWDVRYDDTFNFISSAEETNPLIVCASYGENHDAGGAGEDPPGGGTYINAFNLPPGAIFNTLESFNARALNGLGTGAGQEQVADFVAAGGTFAVGNVYEPFTFSLPDNEFLAGNLLLHGLTFAEAAYASFPALSWQQLALGDPLGRIHLLGDIDDDGDIDAQDTAAFVDCLAGPEVFSPPATCGPADFLRADLDGDGDVDLVDFAEFQAVFAF